MESGRDGGADNRAVSEVISVVLMVAVTIVLAAMVGTVLLNIVSGVDKDPLAGATIKADAANDAITVTFTATQNQGTEIDISVIDTSTGAEVASDTLPDVGDTRTFDSGDGLSDGNTYRVLITARADGKSAVINDVEKSI